MEEIQLSKWESKPEEPRDTVRVGGRAAVEVFEELRYRLESTGMLPDEYFLIDSTWTGDREIPEDSDIFCTVDYGGSEGIYLNLYLTWKENDNKMTKNFATGKTLGESSGDMDRMFLIASAVTQAFNAAGQHARYISFPSPENNDAILHLTPHEKRLLIDSLVDTRNQLIEQTTDIDAILLRVTGGILAYTDELGERPLRIDDFDKAVLAIRDGDLYTFGHIYPSLKMDLGELLIETAGRPGKVGAKMTDLILAEGMPIDSEIYLDACDAAMDIADTERVVTLMSAVRESNRSMDFAMYSDVISKAYSRNFNKLAAQLIEESAQVQIAEAHPYLVVQALQKSDLVSARGLIENGINANLYAAEIIRAAHHKQNDWMLEHLLNAGMQIDNRNLSAFHACVETGNTAFAKHLLSQGMSFEAYMEWAKVKPSGSTEVLSALEEHASTLKPQANGGITMGGM